MVPPDYLLVKESWRVEFRHLDWTISRNAGLSCHFSCFCHQTKIIRWHHVSLKRSSGPRNHLKANPWLIYSHDTTNQNPLILKSILYQPYRIITFRKWNSFATSFRTKAERSLPNRYFCLSDYYTQKKSFKVSVLVDYLPAVEETSIQKENGDLFSFSVNNSFIEYSQLHF